MTKAILKHNRRYQIVKVLNDTDREGLALIRADYSEPFQYIPAPGERPIGTMHLWVNIGELEYLEDDCRCVLPEHSCPVCCEAAREVYGDE